MAFLFVLADKHTDQITQISAMCGENKFNQYVLPTCSISRGAARITKITKQDGRLYHKNKPVDTLDITAALKEFIHWLNDQNKPILIGHNSKKFDCPFLLNALEDAELTAEFRNAISGFADTLPILKEHLPERRIEKKSFKLEYLMKDLLGDEGVYGAHDAAEDVRALQLLVTKQHIPHSLVEKHIFHVNDIPGAKKRDMEADKYVFFDLETTGFSKFDLFESIKLVPNTLWHYHQFTTISTFMLPTKVLLEFIRFHCRHLKVIF